MVTKLKTTATSDQRTTSNVVQRFKLARSNWQGVGEDEHVNVDGKNGKWTFTIKAEEWGHKDFHVFRLNARTPSGDTYQLNRAKPYRTRQEAKQEAEFWIKDIKVKGDFPLSGWKKL